MKKWSRLRAQIQTEVLEAALQYAVDEDKTKDLITCLTTQPSVNQSTVAVCERLLAAKQPSDEALLQRAANVEPPPQAAFNLLSLSSLVPPPFMQVPI